jgi:Icc-related predicted phosphoesterase
MTRGGTNAGCPVLFKTLKELGRCRMHVFGHIHEGHGAIIHEGGGVSVNAAMSGGYGQAVIVDLKQAS